MSANSMSAGDIALLQEILDVARRSGPEAPVEEAFEPVEAAFQVMHLITELVPCDFASFQDIESLGFRLRHAQWVEREREFLSSAEALTADEDDPGFELLTRDWWTRTCSLIERTQRPVVSTALSHVSEREWRQDPVHIEYLGYKDNLLMGLPTSTFGSVRIQLYRYGGRAFDDRDRTLMELLLPHLKPLLVAASQSTQAAEPPTLTVRQREILQLVRLGMSNKRIGRIIGISEGTVRKHLENAFARLGVQSRTAAVAAAFGDDVAAAG